MFPATGISQVGTSAALGGADINATNTTRSDKQTFIIGGISNKTKKNAPKLAASLSLGKQFRLFLVGMDLQGNLDAFFFGSRLEHVANS